MHRFSYGLFSLAILWACAGGDFAQFWQRQLYIAPLLLVVALATVFVEKKRSLFKPNSGSLMMGVGAGVLIAVVCILITAFLPEYIKTQLTPTGFGMLLVSLVIAASSEVLFRGVLQPLWGIWSCAFLEAMNFGFGAQSLSVFALILIAGAATGFIATRFGFVSALIVRAFWWVGVFSYLLVS